ncbi:hypothetical protein V502_02220 [Pseudogymnoascus sp. VKM F-4520 (FW-2644)]|nr:hypothetical protein V502_02220 [Pseudogymnoascus sp. VKM F-4520 (FW-2644)]
MPNLCRRAHKKPRDDEAARVEGAPAKARATREEPFMARMQAPNILCREPPDSAEAQCLGHEEERFFQQQGQDVARAKEDGKAAANVVQGFSSHRSAVMPWLQRTGIKDCLEGLDKEQIKASFSLPKNGEDEPELTSILKVMDEILSEAHSWCFEGPDCMLT